jgi:hypothetical protein
MTCVNQDKPILLDQAVIEISGLVRWRRLPEIASPLPIITAAAFQKTVRYCWESVRQNESSTSRDESQIAARNDRTKLHRSTFRPPDLDFFVFKLKR